MIVGIGRKAPALDDESNEIAPLLLKIRQSADHLLGELGAVQEKLKKQYENNAAARS